MNKFVKAISRGKKVPNYMGGINYELNPLETLKMVTASSIFGEPAYYRDGEFTGKTVRDAAYEVHPLFRQYTVLNDSYNGMKTSRIMEDVIDEALNYDYEGTLQWAVTLREEYYMRLNPQIIMVRAACHPKRSDFTNKNPGMFGRINEAVMRRADEPASQLTYWLYRKGGKSGIPSLLKRSWASKISGMSRYELYKYKNTGIGLVDTIRICHAKGPNIDELMQTGTVALEETNLTWETLRSRGMGWREILNAIDLPYMALLRNLRGIFEEIEDKEICDALMAKLKDGVLHSKQFPFRYWSALKAIEGASVNHKATLMETLETCLDISLDAMPRLKGRTMCLSDNSGSAWGAFNSEYGSVTVAEIDNLSSVITAANSEEGYVGKFGDKLIVTPVLKRWGVLNQTRSITKGQSSDVGPSTENGIWLFFENALKKKEHWDNIFIYSDQQAGHGGLYGTAQSKKVYEKMGFAAGGYIDVAKLIDAYRKQVNPKVNVFSVQTAGYNNVSIPEYGYRTNILYGWTGRELTFAKTMIDFWDGQENQTSKP